VLVCAVLTPAVVSAQTDPVSQARSALRAFIAAWNTGDNVELRKTMNFPFVSLFGGGAVVAETRSDFVTDFEGMRERDGWVRSAFDFDTFEVLSASEDKVHCAIDYRRFDRDGVAYAGGRVMYMVTRRDGHWGLQLRTAFADPRLVEKERSEMLAGARRAVLDFFTAFNSADVEGVSVPLHYPHVFIAGGRVLVAEDSAGGSVRPSFESLREGQGWHMSTIDSIEASYVSADKVHMDLVFSRWHLDGTRYLTVPALWILTRQSDRWGIQLRSLMPATFSAPR
jgi:hypothetical protein